MASILTDQLRVAKQAVVLAPIPNASASFVQYTATAGYGFSGAVNVPLNLQSGVGTQRFRAQVIGEVKTSTTVNVTVNIVLTDSSGTATIIATSGAKAVNNKTGIARLVADFSYDSLAAQLSGQLGGEVDNVLVAAAALSAATQPVLTGTSQSNISVSVQLSGADAASTFTLQQLSIEAL